MIPLEQDTSPSQLEEYYRLLRKLTPAQRLRAASAATRRVRTMAEAGVRLRNPGATDRTVRIEVARLMYGSDTVARLQLCSRP
ncbi:MAG: hypothetical protein ACYC8T_08540 [Myxococcaceae bacterium]